jgi:phosphohistidine phosphatase
MSRTLLLMRHADALPEGVVGDHERPLSEWGRLDARRLAEVIRQEKLVPARIVVSSARRTRETVERMLEHLGSLPVVEEPRLYMASVSTVLEIINDQVLQASPVLIVAHNPCMQSIVSSMAGVLVPFPAASLAHVVLEDGAPPDVRAVWRTEELTLS